MALPTKHDDEPKPPPVINPNAPGAPQPKTEPAGPHPNAADKPFHERIGGGGAPADTPARTRD